VGVDEVLQVGSQLVVGVVEVAFDSRVLDSAVHSFDLPIIRYEIIGASLSGCFGRRYPPILLAAREPLRSKRCTHLIADDSLTPNRAAAARRLIPPRTVVVQTF
jgi:hypothetical protein